MLSLDTSYINKNIQLFYFEVGSGLLVQRAELYRVVFKLTFHSK